jgi:hypothetical protein
MAHSTRKLFLTHRDCANFRKGLCTLNDIAVDPNGPVCPNFVPKGAMTTQPIARVPPQARQPYNLYTPRIQSYPPYVPLYPTQASYSLLSQTLYDYCNRYTDNLTPSTSTAQKADDAIFRSMSRSRGGRGMRRGRMGGFTAGPGGSCVCPRCGYSTPHTVGTPCYQQTCPKCGSRMTRGA